MTAASSDEDSVGSAFVRMSLGLMLCITYWKSCIPFYRFTRCRSKRWGAKCEHWNENKRFFSVSPSSWENQILFVKCSK